MLIVLCSFSQNEKDERFAVIVHCQINKEYQFVIIKVGLLVFPKRFAPFCHSFWFDSGSVAANPVRQATRATRRLVSVKLNLFLLMPTEIVANRWGKRSFLPASTFNANI